MSEILVTSAPIAEQQQDPNQLTQMRRALIAAAGVMLTVSACSGGSGDADPTSSPSPSETATTAAFAANASEACNDSVDTAANLANTNYGATDAFLPGLSTTDAKGGIKLVSAEKASEALRHQFSHDTRATAIFNAFFLNVRDGLQGPDAGTLKQGIDLISDYNTIPDHALAGITEACNSVEPRLLRPTDKFAVIKGQAMVVSPKRDPNNQQIIGWETSVYNDATGSLTGFEVMPNLDVSNLTQSQKDLWTKYAGLILIDGKGRVIINTSFGPSQFNVTTKAPETPIKVKANGDSPVEVKIGDQKGTVPAGSNNQQKQQSQGGSSSKQSSTGKGSGPSGGGADHQSGPNTGPSTGTQSGGTGTGSGPSGGGGNTGPSTGPTGPTGGETSQPSPAPTHEQPTPTPNPTTEQPTPPPPTPTKAPDPCDPNTGEICGTSTAMTLKFNDNQWTVV